MWTDVLTRFQVNHEEWNCLSLRFSSFTKWPIMHLLPNSAGQSRPSLRPAARFLGDKQTTVHWPETSFLTQPFPSSNLEIIWCYVDRLTCWCAQSKKPNICFPHKSQFERRPKQVRFLDPFQTDDTLSRSTWNSSSQKTHKGCFFPLRENMCSL